MYLPEQYKETNPERISEFIKSHSFGILITSPNGAPFASHLPFLFEPSSGSRGKLLGHMARANPQWQHFAENLELLVVFQGPHAYISPSWYSSPGVPTWNYTTIHIKGKPLLIENESQLETLVEQLTSIHEANLPTPWKPNLIGERRSKLLNMIVGFEIEITDIQAKFKLSQNRPLEDQLRIINELSQSNHQIETAVAKLMSEGIKTNAE
ncbi:MAG: FMN-binding negative transcriptional regulator [Methylococcales bacterium]